MAIPNTVAENGPLTYPGMDRQRWHQQLPDMLTRRLLLREVRAEDAPALVEALARAEVQEYLPNGPTDIASFRKFIDWVRGERRAGRYLCFAAVLRETRACIGLFQIWPIEPGFGTAEFGFALDPRYWGKGLFTEAASALIDFGIDVLQVHRFECRSAPGNTRGAAALRKLGAQPEGTLRECFPCPGGYLDHTMWSILAHEWRARSGA